MTNERRNIAREDAIKEATIRSCIRVIFGEPDLRRPTDAKVILREPQKKKAKIEFEQRVEQQLMERLRERRRRRR